MAKPPRPRKEPKRDQNGRYVIPDPETGKERSWTRVSTIADTVEETYNLNGWKMRMAAVGLARRPDLLARVAAVPDPTSYDGKRTLNALIEDAKEYAGSTTRSNLGTALHSFCESLDTGREVPHIPAPFDKDVAAYQAKLKEYRVEVSPNFVERICVIPELGAAGTLDRLVKVNGRIHIGDLKTGDDLSYAAGKISIQLACYSRARWIYDLEDETFCEWEDVDQDQALVIHLPAGQARCELLWADLQAGWEAVQHCMWTRNWRGRKDLLTPVGAVKEAVA